MQFHLMTTSTLNTIFIHKKIMQLKLLRILKPGLITIELNPERPEWRIKPVQ